MAINKRSHKPLNKEQKWNIMLCGPTTSACRLRSRKVPPIQLPDRFTLAANLRVADKLKLQLPTVFLARVDEVIE
jgi:hypothetical protein